MTRLVLVLGDQCTGRIAALNRAEKAGDVVVMAEVAAEATYVPHHPKKIAFVFSVMRHFADSLRGDGWKVDYSRLDSDAAPASISEALLAAAERHGASEVIATEPGEHRLIAELTDLPLDVTLFEDDRFIASHAEFDAWAEGKKALRMEFFYREMRRKTGFLMEGDDPAGGAWNYDSENRKPPPEGIGYSGPMRFTPDDTTEEVLDLVARRFGNNFGSLEDFWFAVTPGDARRHLARWVREALPLFGDYQDAMMEGEAFLYHSVTSLYIHAGLLDPLEVCRAAEEAWKAGEAPLNAVEGFIRQIIGWREYVRGIYFREGPDYVRRNALNHQRALPPVYWGGPTRMACMKSAVAEVEAEAYGHHIQRLMVTGNFALLAGIDPAEVHEWYLAVFADAYEWVEAPNVIGMSQFADGGIVASKPYVSSGNYINRMSDHCRGCHYSVTKKTGEGACPFNLLYWNFLHRHRDRLDGNPRISRIYATWDRMDAGKRETILAEADDILDRLSAGEPV